MQITVRYGAFVLAMLAAIFLVAVYSAEEPRRDYRLGSIPADTLPTPYAVDPRDSWNRIFRALFTRDVTLRLTDEYPQGAPFSVLTTPSFLKHHAVSEHTFFRRESGDRAIVPLYPSFFSTAGLEQVLREPDYTQFKQALGQALAEPGVRSPLERALMQADLWAAYDVLYGRQTVDGVSAARFDVQRAQLLPLLARLIHKMALSSKEISDLRSNYWAAESLGVPPLLDGASGWIEVEWRPERLHDHDAAFRTVARVFLKPRTRPADKSEFVNRLRYPEREPLTWRQRHCSLSNCSFPPMAHWCKARLSSMCKSADSRVIRRELLRTLPSRSSN